MQESYYVDADHIGLETVDLFMACSNFLTLDVADAIGKAASDADITLFLEKHKDLIGSMVGVVKSILIHCVMCKVAVIIILILDSYSMLVIK